MLQPFDDIFEFHLPLHRLNEGLDFQSEVIRNYNNYFINLPIILVLFFRNT